MDDSIILSIFKIRQKLKKTIILVEESTFGTFMPKIVL